MGDGGGPRGWEECPQSCPRASAGGLEHAGWRWPVAGQGGRESRLALAGCRCSCGGGTLELPSALREGLKMPVVNWKTLVMAALHSSSPLPMTPPGSRRVLVMAAWLHGSPLPMTPPGSRRVLRKPATYSESLELSAGTGGGPWGCWGCLGWGKFLEPLWEAALQLLGEGGAG